MVRTAVPPALCPATLSGFCCRLTVYRGVADKYQGSTPLEHLTASWTYTLSFYYGEKQVPATIPLYTFPDETLSPSVTLLINLFGQVCVSCLGVGVLLLLLEMD